MNSEQPKLPNCIIAYASKPFKVVQRQEGTHNQILTVESCDSNTPYSIVRESECQLDSKSNTFVYPIYRQDFNQTDYILAYNVNIFQLDDNKAVMASYITILNLDDNQVKNLSIIGLLENLESLSLSSNHITELPEDMFTKLTKLCNLDLQFNDITHLPKSMAQLKELRNLRLSYNNHFTFHQRNIGQIVCEWGKLEFVDVQNTAVQTVPVEITRHSRLRGVNCKRTNMFYFLPHSTRYDSIKVHSLLELTKRVVGQTKDITNLPVHLQHDLQNFKICSYCQKVYFSKDVTRSRWWRANGSPPDAYGHYDFIVITYRMCCRHFEQGELV